MKKNLIFQIRTYGSFYEITQTIRIERDFGNGWNQS